MVWKMAAYAAVALSLGGNVGVVQRKRWGMGVWVLANVIWVAYHARREDWPSAILFGAYLGLAVWGFAKWRS
jgi:hypothetical protein